MFRLRCRCPVSLRVGGVSRLSHRISSFKTKKKKKKNTHERKKGWNDSANAAPEILYLNRCLFELKAKTSHQSNALYTRILFKFKVVFVRNSCKKIHTEIDGEIFRDDIHLSVLIVNTTLESIQRNNCCSTVTNLCSLLKLLLRLIILFLRKIIHNKLVILCINIFRILFRINNCVVITLW